MDNDRSPYTFRPALFYNDNDNVSDCFSSLLTRVSKCVPSWSRFWTTETGGVLNEVKHLYAFTGNRIYDTLRIPKVATNKSLSKISILGSGILVTV